MLPKSLIFRCKRSPFQSQWENVHLKGATLGHLMFKVTLKTPLASFVITKITLIAYQRTIPLQ